MPTSDSPASVLGLFPQFGNGHFGGIQASAALAWQAISQSRRAELLTYSRNAGDSNGDYNNSRIRAVLAAIMQKNGLDLVLIWHLGLIKLMPFLRHDSSRVALFIHGIEAWKDSDWLTRRLANKVDLFLSNSDYTWERFLLRNPQLVGANHLTVPLGIAQPIAVSEAIRPSQPVALMLSRLSRAENYKGHREVIEAWPAVLREQPQAQLWIAGAGDLIEELKETAAKQNAVSSVKFLGAVSEVEKERLLQQSRCLLMPSKGEGFGLVYLEAMRAGRPCLVSTSDAGREVVNPPEAGLAVNMSNGQELASAILQLMSDGPQWQRWSLQARERYEKNFTAAHFQQRLLDALFRPGSVTNPIEN